MLKFFRNILSGGKNKIEIDESMMDQKSINQFFKGPRYNQTIIELGNQRTRKLKQGLDKSQKEIRVLEEKIRNKHREKDPLIQKIMELSHEINTENKEERTKELDRAKCEIEKIKAEIQDLNENLETEHLRRKDLQKQLYKNMAEVSYSRFLYQQQKLLKVNKNISVLRGKLDNLREEKEGIESELGQLYQMLHGVMGHEQIEQMDFAFLKTLTEEEQEATKDD